jgi:putative ABC transport system permease protein
MSRDGPWVTVVGIAENTVAESLGEKPVPYVYFSIEQALGGFGPPLDAALLVLTNGSPETLLPVLREQLRALDSEVPLYDLQPFEFHVRELVMPQRMGVTLFGFFSLLALSLATVGIYGVASYVAALRTREIGIRMALGADATRIGRLVLVEGALPIGVGICVGLCLALWAHALSAASCTA